VWHEAAVTAGKAGKPAALAAALLSLAVLNLIPGQPAEPAVITGLIIWFVLTSRGDLAPRPRDTRSYRGVAIALPQVVHRLTVRRENPAVASMSNRDVAPAQPGGVSTVPPATPVSC
jgi:hypothetical protein